MQNTTAKTKAKHKSEAQERNARQQQLWGRLGRGVFAGDFQMLRSELGAAVGGAPAGDIFGATVGDADDDVAVPGPCVGLIELARPGWMIGVRVIPADDVDSLFARSFLGVANVFGCDGEAITRGVVAPID